MIRALPRIDVDAVKRAHPLAATAARRYGVALRPAGRGRLLARCPLPGHARDRDPSFVVYADQGRYHCFGCRSGGDVIDLVAAIEGLPFVAAVAALTGGPPPLAARRPARPAPRAPPLASPATPLAASDPVLGAALALAVDHYAGRLARDPAARAYLAGRGLDRATVDRWRLGLGGGLAAELRRRRTSSLPFRRLGLLGRDGRERFAGRVVIPDLVAGRPTWLTGRLLPGAADPAARRFDSLPGPRPLLGLGRLPPQRDRVVVVEGIFDLLLLDAWGWPAVALGGAGWTRAQAAALARFQQVWLLFDADEAGQRATAALAAALGQRATPVAVPAGAKDVGDLATLPDGRAHLAALLPPDLAVATASHRVAGRTPIGRAPLQEVSR
ncbi:MAG: toprim domain-containing protein [Chloroflexi bacterium]|nr:toprim domain-containing protein [Chloroflexota bacterium]